MNSDTLKNLMVGGRYLFTLSDGRKLNKRGSWLLGKGGAHWHIDEAKAALVTDVEPCE